MTDLEYLAQIKSALLTALLTDIAKPFGTYSIDGQMVSRDRFRQWAGDFLGVLNQLMQAENPYEIRTGVL